MRTILADLRKINEIVQYDNVWRDSETADLPFNKLTEILGSLLKVDFIYCFNRWENAWDS